ncbi:hypothetical protein EFR84_19160 [Rhizobium chutanense]|uniref:Uncharacterized protein n=1 Tax=Rhizobium chutanense TaxID=2035448 RepID=A0A432NWN3_9HYPH|nr:hypothetical protein EFR84_19160 [Rhizobium chutanense]
MKRTVALSPWQDARGSAQSEAKSDRRFIAKPCSNQEVFQHTGGNSLHPHRQQHSPLDLTLPQKPLASP